MVDHCVVGEIESKPETLPLGLRLLRFARGFLASFKFTAQSGRESRFGSVRFGSEEELTCPGGNMANLSVIDDYDDFV